MINPVYICGTGNVATALVLGFQKSGIPIEGMYSRKKMGDFHGIRMLDYLQKPLDNALVFFAVSDDAVVEVEKHFLESNIYAVHCSGSLSLASLKSSKKGVFYPLQTWTKDTDSVWKDVPIFLEANHQEVLEILFEISAILGVKVGEADSAQRKALHVAAVFVNNFSNAMFDIGYTLAKKAGFEPEVMLPLIKKTVDKLQTKTPELAQTGPARRGDIRVIQEHLESLQNDPELAIIYKAISDYIGHRQPKP